MDTVTYGAAIAYVKQTANALGAVKGAPCTVKSITEGEEGSTIVFAWTGNDGVEQTGTTFIPRGIKGNKGDDGFSPDIKVSTINGGHRVTITDADGSQSFDVMDGINGTGGTVEVDATLTEAGKAADAKAVGDAIGKVSEEKADKKDIPAPYTLPTASADVKGGVKVGNGLQMNGEALCISNGLKLINTTQIPEGEVVETIMWNLDEYYDEIQMFCTFPPLPDGAAPHRLVVNAGGCVIYMPNCIITGATTMKAWVRVDNRDNVFPLEGFFAGPDAYNTNASKIGNFIKPYSKTKSLSFNQLVGGYPTGTTIKVYAR